MNRLKELRAKRKVTQSDLAKLLKCSNNTISRYEIGEREPDFKTLSELADYFNVTTDYLLGRTDDPTPPFKAPETFYTVPMVPLTPKEQKKEALSLEREEELLREFFHNKIGRDPTREEFLKLKEFTEIFVKGFNK